MVRQPPQTSPLHGEEQCDLGAMNRGDAAEAVDLNCKTTDGVGRR